jgi:hypothetical protein
MLGSFEGGPDEKVSVSISASIAGDGSKRFPEETDRAFKFRLDTETEELVKLHDVIKSMYELHARFLDVVEQGWDEELATFLIGDVVTEFTHQIMSPYSTYAVIALSGMNKSHLKLTSRGEVEHSEFVNRIVNKYVFSSLNLETAQEPSEQDWAWYLHRPIHRLMSYSGFLSEIHGETKTKLNPAIDSDNKKLRIANIKIGCTATAISEHLKRAGYQQ